MGEFKRLSECEEFVMTIVWRADEAPDLKTVLDAVNQKYGKTWKPQTVSTFLARLIKKGFLESYRKGRYTYYVPKVALKDYRKEVVAETIKVLYGGEAADMVVDVEN